MTERTQPRPFSAEERLDWLRLIRSDNVGPITFRRLIERFGTAARALDALPGLAKRGGAKALAICPKAKAEDELAKADAIGAQMLCRDEAGYPPLLAQMEDAPPVIYLLGHGHLLAKRSIAVVGARNASINGCRFAETLGAELGQGGLLVVSGMARGIDAGAHAGALPTGTLAVLAGGVDNIYPKENAGLYERIKAEGAIVSEAPPGTVPQARHFPSRNRLIAGISRGVVVVEAAPKSGSLITARLALEAGREVFAVPGSPLDPRSRGANDLIRQGATLTESAADVIATLADLFRQPLRAPAGPAPTDQPLAPPSESEIDAARDLVVSQLGPSPTAVDEVIRRCHFSPSVVATVLLELELAGRLERHPGNSVSLL